MDEILEISDDVSIMRDGKHIGTWPAASLTKDLIIKHMVGRDLTQMFPPKDNVPGDEIMAVEGLTSASDRSFRDVSFNLRKGEILGIGGLVGAQRTELVEALFGLRPIAEGTVKIHDKEVKIKSSRDAQKHGMALVTEERRETGIFSVLSVEDNTLISSYRKFVDAGFVINNGRGSKAVVDSIKQLRVKTPNKDTQIRNLSGGNQQKVILSRWLLTDPEILILDEPTRGIDVGAKYEIYNIMLDLARKGKSIIMISSEMPELLGMSDRVMVMCEGQMTGILEREDAHQESIMELATNAM
jgi:methyl-galactoside transport system ATP-binding protein